MPINAEQRAVIQCYLDREQGPNATGNYADAYV